METRSDNTLENLEPQKREWLLEFATDPRVRLPELLDALKERGVEVSKSTLSRFLTRHREKVLLESGKESKGALEKLAERAKEGKLREGTLEVVRQRLYERALESESPEEARQLYGAMVKEEAKLQELELERRRLALAEEELKLKALATRAALAGKVKGEIVENVSLPGPHPGPLPEGAEGEGEEEGRKGLNHGEHGAEVTVVEGAGVAQQLPANGASAKERVLMELVERVSEIVNRGGDLNELILEARDVLAEGVKECGGAIKSAGQK